MIRFAGKQMRPAFAACPAPAERRDRHTGALDRFQQGFMFADFHAEQIEGSALPNGSTAADSDLRSAATLIGKPYPLWRLDQ